MEENVVIDVHCHLFDNRSIPKGHRKRQTKIKPSVLKWILQEIEKIIKRRFDERVRLRLLKNIRAMLDISQCDNIEDVKKLLTKGVDVESKRIYVPLLMDMQHDTKNGEILLPYDDQIEEMSNLILKNPGEFLPFIAADPRTIMKEGPQYIYDALEQKGFWGVKIYPPLGYEPNHPNLIELYKYCIENNIPVTTHCCYGGSFSTSETGLYGEKLSSNKDRLYYWGRMPHPKRWFDMMRSTGLQKLKLNLAHFGGDELGRRMKYKFLELFKTYQAETEKEWRNLIVSELKNNEFPNLYTDVSFHPMFYYEREKYFLQLAGYLSDENLKRKIMFGSDWWMSRYLIRENDYILKYSQFALQNGIKENDLHLIMCKNAMKFLGLDKPGVGPFNNYINFLKKKEVYSKLPSWFKMKFNC